MSIPFSFECVVVLLFIYDAAHAGKIASYFRRISWQQSNLAACVIMQIDKQIAAANIRVDKTTQELVVRQQQIKDSQDVQDFLTNKIYKSGSL